MSRRRFLSISAMAASVVGIRGLEALASSPGRPGTTEGRPRVAVIGAGLGGLTAAAFLARNGWDVTVIEQHSIPGGYATSFDRAGGRFSFDVSLHATVARGSSAEGILRATGVLDKVEAVRLPELCRVVYPDLDMTWPQADPDGLIRLLSGHFPAEAQGIRGVVELMLRLEDEASRIPPRMGPEERRRFPELFPAMWEIRDLTLAELLDKYTQDRRLRSVLTTFGGYHGLPPSRLSAFYYGVATGGYIRHGGWYYRPRSQGLSDALAGVVLDNGGRVLLSTRARSIRLEGGAVSGVEDESGRFHAAEAVISGINAPETFTRLLPPGAVPEEYLARLGALTPSMSCFIVWLGLKGDIRSRTRSYEMFLRETDNEAAFRAGLEGNPEQCSAAVTVYDNAYAGYSSPGTSTVSVMTGCGYEPWRRFEADYLAGRKDAYKREKERWARILIAKAEKVLPGLSDMIEVREAATPLTCLRYTGNPGGAIYGYSQTLDNAFMTRLRNRTPVGGLYLASAWTSPGGGFTGVQQAGMNACRDLLEDLEKGAQPRP